MSSFEAKNTSLYHQIGVVVAIAIVALAIAIGLMAEARMSPIVALVFGVSAFIFLFSVHGLLRHYKQTLSLSPRIDTVERSVGRLSRDLADVNELSGKFAKIEGLAEEVADLQAALSTSPAYEELNNRDEIIDQIAQELNNLQDEVRDLKTEFRLENKLQKNRLDSELQVLQTLIKQMAERTGVTPDAANLNIAGRAIARTTPPPQPPGHNDTAPRATPAAKRRQQRQKSVSGGGPARKERPQQEAGSEASPAQGRSETNTLGLRALVKAKDQASHSQTSASNLRPDRSDPDAGENTAPEDLLSLIRQSIESNRVELFLQPIVSLPDQTVRYYEGLTRLRNKSGEPISAIHYVDVAERSGMMPLIDNIMLFRSVQVIRRLTEQSSPRGVFCNISPLSLLDDEFFPEFITFMAQNTELSQHLFFEFQQSMIDSASKEELEGIQQLAELGYTLSLDQVTTLDIDYQHLYNLGFGFLKLDAQILLDGMQEAGASIHAADMAHYLKRQGLSLIVEKVEDKHTLERLSDHDIALAQGYLFSEPRPVRPEVFGDTNMTAAA